MRHAYSARHWAAQTPWGKRGTIAPEVDNTVRRYVVLQQRERRIGMPDELIGIDVKSEI
jgi:hypothetical protein